MEMLELKIGQRGITFLIFVGFCGEFPIAGLKMFRGYYDYNRRLVTQLVREGYLKERKIKGYDRHVIRSLSLSAKGLAKLQDEDPAMAKLIAQHSLAPADGQGDRQKTLRIHRSAWCLLTAARIGAYWLPTKGKDKKLKEGAVYYGAYELNKMYGQDNKGARASGVLINEGQIFILYYLGDHNMYWTEKSEDMFQDQVVFSPLGNYGRITGNIYIGEHWELSKSLIENACRPFSRMIKFQRGMFHHYVTTDDNGIAVLRTIVFWQERQRLQHKLFAHGVRSYFNQQFQFDLDCLSGYYEPPHESQYKVRPNDGYFFDFQIDAVKSFCNTDAELISVPGTLLHEK